LSYAQPKLPDDQMKTRNVALVQTVYINETMAELIEMLKVSTPEQLKTRIPFIQAQIDSLQVVQEKVNILFEIHPKIQPSPEGDTLLYFSMVRTNSLSDEFFTLAQNLHKQYKDSVEINKQFTAMFEHFSKTSTVREQLIKTLLSAKVNLDSLTEGQLKLREFNLENAKLLRSYVTRLQKAKSASVATNVLIEYKQFLKKNSEKVEKLFKQFDFKSTVTPQEASMTGLSEFMGAVKEFEEALRESKEKFGKDPLFSKAYSSIRSK
jgi:hypothetical protein